MPSFSVSPRLSVVFILLALVSSSSASDASLVSSSSPPDMSCKKDSDCREGKKCVSSKWSGGKKNKVCKLEPDECKDSSDCDPCSECAQRRLWGEEKSRKVCVPRYVRNRP